MKKKNPIKELGILCNTCGDKSSAIILGEYYCQKCYWIYLYSKKKKSNRAKKIKELKEKGLIK